MSLTDDGIVIIRFESDITVTLEVMQEFAKNQLELAGGKKVPILIVTKNIKAMTRNARQFVGKEAITEHTSAMAVVVESYLERVLGKFFMGFNRPPFPTKLFFSVEDGIEWLRSSVNNVDARENNNA